MRILCGWEVLETVYREACGMKNLSADRAKNPVLM